MDRNQKKHLKKLKRKQLKKTRIMSQGHQYSMETVKNVEGFFKKNFSKKKDPLFIRLLKAFRAFFRFGFKRL